METAGSLAHYGVKGMRWGQSKRTTVAREAVSDDAAKVSNTHSRVKAQKSTKMLSNKELQDAITRMNLEQQYSKMTGGLDKTTKEKAKAYVSDLLDHAAKMPVAKEKKPGENGGEGQS
jgi:hypothetical protein